MCVCVCSGFLLFQPTVDYARLSRGIQKKYYSRFSIERFFSTVSAYTDDILFALVVEHRGRT